MRSSRHVGISPFAPSKRALWYAKLSGPVLLHGEKTMPDHPSTTPTHPASAPRRGPPPRPRGVYDIARNKWLDQFPDPNERAAEADRLDHLRARRVPPPWTDAGERAPHHPAARTFCRTNAVPPHGEPSHAAPQLKVSDGAVTSPHLGSGAPLPASSYAALPASSRAPLPRPSGNVGVSQFVAEGSRSSNALCAASGWATDPPCAPNAVGDRCFVERATRILADAALNRAWSLRMSAPDAEDRFDTPDKTDGDHGECEREKDAKKDIKRPPIGHLRACEARTALRTWLEVMSPRTLAQYDAKAAMLARQTGTQISVRTAPAFAVAVLRHCEMVKATSARLYKASAAAAVAQLAVEQDDLEDLSRALGAFLVIDACRSEAADGAERGAEACHARRSREGFAPMDRATLKDALRPSGSSRARTLVDLIDTIILTGMRPSEVCSATMELALGDRVVVPVDDGAVRTLMMASGEPNARGSRRVPAGVRLTIQNGKFNSIVNRNDPISRAHGPARTLRYRPGTLSWRAFSGLYRTLRWASGFTRDEWDVEVEAHSRLLRDICGRLWKHRKRGPSLYSGRHQFAANAKLAYHGDASADATVAALMGHASDDTANKHYARRGKGTRGAVVPQANPDEVARVRRVREDRLERLKVAKAERRNGPRA